LNGIPGLDCIFSVTVVPMSSEEKRTMCAVHDRKTCFLAVHLSKHNIRKTHKSKGKNADSFGGEVFL